MIYGDGLLTVTPEGLTIDTALSAREAGQAKLSQHQTEPGVILTISDDGTVEYGTWRWTGSHEDIAPGRKVYSVYVDGEPFDGKPLLSIMEEAEADDDTLALTARETFRKAVNALSRAVEDAAEKGIYLPDNGPLGTLVADDGRILLLPENIFVRALDSRSDRDASRFAGCWKNTALSSLDAWRFTLACYAYRYVSGRSAFPQQDSQIRTADYFDRNFIPLDWFCTLNGIEGNDDGKITAGLYKAIYTNLTKAAPVQKTEKQKKKKTARRNNIDETPSVPLPELTKFETRECTNYALSSGYIRQQKKLKKTRFVRQNSLAIKWCSIGAAVLLFFTVTYIKDKLAIETTKGLEPQEVLIMMYDAYDQLNTTVFDVTHTDDCAKDASTYLSTMFVTSKMRQSYEGMGTYTMNQWLSTKVLSHNYIFGLTNLTFTPVGMEPPADTPADISDSFTWKVDYFIVYNMGNEEFSYIEQSDLVTISWKKNRWLVTDFETVKSIPHEDAALTLTTEATMLQPEEYSIDQGAEILAQLKDKYPWLPTEAELAKGKQQLLDGWNATEYQKVLSIMDLK